MINRKRKKGYQESPEILKHRAKELSQPPESEDSRKPPAMRALLFNLGEKIFAIDTQFIKEILNPFSLKWVPFTPKFIAGVVNLRGNIITVFDLKAFQDTNDQQLGSEIIILKYEDLNCGFLVDSTTEIIAANDDEILDPISTDCCLSLFIGYTIKKENQLYQVIDLYKVLSSEEVTTLKKSKDADVDVTESSNV